MPRSATHMKRHCCRCRSADVRHCGPAGALRPSYLVDARAACLLHPQRAVAAWVCDGLHSCLALLRVSMRASAPDRTRKPTWKLAQVSSPALLAPVARRPVLVDALLLRGTARDTGDGIAHDLDDELDIRVYQNINRRAESSSRSPCPS